MNSKERRRAYSLDLLEKLYRTMVRIRLCEESLVEPIDSGEIRTPCHLYSGQEAIAVGVCSNLERMDYVFGAHRSHGHFLAKGGCMKALVAEIFCGEAGCSSGRGGSMHLIDPQAGIMGVSPIVASTISLAIGAALASSIKRDKRVTVSFFGDGAVGEGVLYECLNFAALKRLPIVFVCENNYYATHMPIGECRVDSPIYRIAEPFCIESRQVDGNDVLQVYETAREAVEKCRGNRGPVFLEYLTYRLRGHVGSDDNIQGMHTDIRPKEEVEEWMKRDPITKFEQYLIDNQVLDKCGLEKIREEVQKEVLEAHLYARQSSTPDGEELTNHVFHQKALL